VPISIPNPYTGQDDETCSVSFQAQQQMAAGVGSPQTEAEYNQSKLLGEWGVVKAKMKKGQIPNGTKVLTYTNSYAQTRGYVFVSDGKLVGRKYGKDGVPKTFAVTDTTGDNFIKSDMYKVSIPQAVSPKPKPEPVPITAQDLIKLANLDPTTIPDGKVVAVKPSGEYVKWNASEQYFQLMVPEPNGFGLIMQKQTEYADELIGVNHGWFKPDGKDSTSNAQPQTTTSPPAPTQVAAPTPTTPVNAGSTSVGSMSHEDVSAMFVKIKDDLAKEKGLNIKGANAALDEEVYKAIGNATGYTSAEVKAKIDAYKAAGNKLSALKKKVLAGTKKVPTGNAPQTAPKPSTPLVPTPAVPKPDPKPNGVPTVATNAVTNAVKQEVKQAAEADPGKVYSDEDVSSAYIIAKDKIVAASNGKWTLYSKNDELDALIFGEVQAKTGLDKSKAQVAIANYLASGKKLSQLKKALAKQGAFKPEADTLKKSGAAKTQAEKDAEVAAKAAAGYTPTPTPAAGSPPVDTGKPMPKAAGQKAREAGDITGLPASVKTDIYSVFKSTGSLSYLSAQNQSTYEALVKTQVAMKAENHDLSLLQILRIVDEEGAKKFAAENANLFEKKTATWLTTPEGTAYVKSYEKKLAKIAEEAKLKKEAEAAAKELEANQPPLPADSGSFKELSLAEAKALNEKWQRANPWSDRERRDLKHYTGSAYTEMNGYLRGIKPSISDRSKNAIEGAKQGMRPTTEPLLLKRGTGLDQFKTLGLGRGNGSIIWGITGKTFKDEGFLSTSAGGRAAFGGEARLEIECPVGTPMAYVAPISNFPSENEMLLQAGMEYKVLNVRKQDGVFYVRVRVVNWPGKAS
jgi:hypothetical protein